MRQLTKTKFRPFSLQVVSSALLCAFITACVNGSDSDSDGGGGSSGPGGGTDPPGPVIESIDPAEGDFHGGYQVLIVGSGFVEGVEEGSTSVPFGGVDAIDVVVHDDFTITCEVPEGLPGEVDVVVSNSVGDSDPIGFLYIDEPSDDPLISSIDPTEGPPEGETSVTITGSQFELPGFGETTVTFGGVEADLVEVVDDATITCESPPGVDGETVEVIVSNDLGDSLPFDGFTYDDPSNDPVISSIDPTEGLPEGETPVTITGSQFDLLGSGETTVTFGGVVADLVEVVDDATITCESPPGVDGETVEVIVSNDLGDSLPFDGFTYDDPSNDPVITSIDPIQGDFDVETSVTITGSQFALEGSGVTSVSFGGGNATSVRVEDDTSITCAAPLGVAGTTVDVTVINALGSSVLEDAFSFTGGDPVLLAIDPVTGDFAGETSVTITGLQFDLPGSGVTTVMFGEGVATYVLVVDDATITCVSPSGDAGGTVDVTVSNVLGSSVLEDAFSFTGGEPVLLAVDPAEGDEDGGDPITLTGERFTEVNAGETFVTFGGVDADLVEVVDDTTITCVSPHGVGEVDVVVSNDLGSSQPQPFLFLEDPEAVEGDLDGDGLMDLVIGAPRNDSNGERAGAVHVFLSSGALVSVGDLPASSADLILVGAAEGDYFGATVATGDLNDDGEEDLIVGASRAGAGGMVYVFIGPLSPGSLSTDDADHVLSGEGTHLPSSTLEDRFGTSLSVSDIDADEVDDLVVGATGRDLVTLQIPDVGAAYVFLGRSDLPALINASGADVLLTGESAEDKFGCSSGTGDFNGDGQFDLFVGASGASPFVPAQLWDGGGVFLWLGPVTASGSSEDADASYYMIESHTGMGSTVDIGDVNGDGFDDLVTGAPNGDSNVSGGAGVCLVFCGDSVVYSRNASSSDVFLSGMGTNSHFGRALVVADFDGDGVEDILVTAPDQSYGAVNNGRAFLFKGGPGLCDSWGGEADVSFAGRFRTYEQFGESAAAVDKDGDGSLDICVGAFGADQALIHAGSVHVFLGGAGLVDTDADDDDLTLEGEQEAGFFGRSISSPE